MEDFDSLWIISRLFLYNDWKDIVKNLEEHIQTKICTNALFVDKALICLTRGNFENLIENPSKWWHFGPFHILFEKWNKFKHGRLEVIRGFGGWLSINNLPLDYWKKMFLLQLGITSASSRAYS